MINSQSMKANSQNCSGLVHRETAISYCGSTSAVKLLIGYAKQFTIRPIPRIRGKNPDR